MTFEYKCRNGHAVLMDDEDAATIGAKTWYTIKKGDVSYAVRLERDSVEKYRRVYMHRLIMGFPSGEVDHINGDGCDNRRANLRVVTRLSNALNRGKQSNNRSGFKGVYWHTQRQKWAASLRLYGKKISLGLHDTAEAASQAYQAKFRDLFGDSHPRAMIRAANKEGV